MSSTPSNNSPVNNPPSPNSSTTSNQQQQQKATEPKGGQKPSEPLPPTPNPKRILAAKRGSQNQPKNQNSDE